MSCYRCPVERSASAFGVYMCFCVRVQVQRVPLPHRHLLKWGSSRNQESVFLPIWWWRGSSICLWTYIVFMTQLFNYCFESLKQCSAGMGGNIIKKKILNSYNLYTITHTSFVFFVFRPIYFFTFLIITDILWKYALCMNETKIKFVSFFSYYFFEKNTKIALLLVWSKILFFGNNY